METSRDILASKRTFTTPRKVTLLNGLAARRNGLLKLLSGPGCCASSEEPFCFRFPVDSQGPMWGSVISIFHQHDVDFLTWCGYQCLNSFQIFQLYMSWIVYSRSIVYSGSFVYETDDWSIMKRNRINMNVWKIQSIEMTFFKQLRLLIWKNLSLRRRQMVCVIDSFLYDFLDLLCWHFALEERQKCLLNVCVFGASVSV